jgi:hypothetical protein
MALLFEIHFCNPAPESFRFLKDRSLLCTQDPGKNRDDAIGSPGAKRRRGGGRGRWGEGGGGPAAHLWIDLRARRGVGRHLAAAVASTSR